MAAARILAVVLAAFVTGVPLTSGATSAQTPAPEITSGPSSMTSATSATFQFTDADPVAVFECRLDGQGFSLCLSPRSYSNLQDGQHTFFVRAVDPLQSEPTSEPASYTWTIDTTPPPPPTIKGPPNPTNSTSATFTFADSEAGVSFGCRLDGSGFPPCSNPSSYAGPLAAGEHTLRARAIDALGNASAITVYTWTIDLTPPVVPTIGSHAKVVGSATTTFAFGSADAARYECHVDAAASAHCSSGDTFGPLADGPHTFFVRAFDSAGNASSVASFQWTIDTVDPIVTLTGKPPAITNQSTASFSFSSNRPGSTFECSLDGGFEPCSNTSPVVYRGLGDGAHTFSVRATAVTTGPATKYTWTVDTVAPNTALTAIPPASSSSATASFAFTSSEPGSTFVCSLDASGITPCESPTTYGGLGDGTHTFRVRAVDAAGNTDASPASHTWQITGVGPATIDRTPPEDVKRLRRNVAYGVLNLTWTRPSSPDFDHVKIFVSSSAQGPPRTVVYTGARAKYTNKSFKNGLYYRYAVLSYDRAGNASRGKSVVVPPSILLRFPRDGAVVKAPPVLKWSKIAKASYYNVQLYHGKRKVLSAWPSAAKLGVTQRWLYENRRYRLDSGVYHWFVWPGFGLRSKARYGQLLGQGAFTVR